MTTTASALSPAPATTRWGAVPGVFVVRDDELDVILIAPNHSLADSDPSLWTVRPREDSGDADETEQPDLVLIDLATVLGACTAPGFRDAAVFVHRRALAELERELRKRAGASWPAFRRRESMKAAARHLRSQLDRAGVPGYGQVPGWLQRCGRLG